jgi:hypothetical protein
MRRVPRRALALFCLALLAATARAATAALAPLAHSAQVSVEGASTPAGLALRIVPTPPATSLAVSGVSVSVDGKSVAATRAADGSWLAPLGSPGSGERLEIMVDHDGIREVLTAGAVPAAAAPPAPATGLLGDHKQMAWWILNIAIVLIAALAISRRRS